MSKLRSFLADVIGAAHSTAAEQSTRAGKNNRGAAPMPEVRHAPAPEAGASRDEKPDVDSIAQEVFEELRRSIDVGRQRNGDPFI
jgi:hypothetical protein